MLAWKLAFHKLFSQPQPHPSSLSLTIHLSTTPPIFSTLLCCLDYRLTEIPLNSILIFLSEYVYIYDSVSVLLHEGTGLVAVSVCGG